MEIGERIRQRRCELGMSLRDLADKMNYKNHSTIARIERGDVDLPISRVVQFADVLNLPVEYLLGIAEKPAVDALQHFAAQKIEDRADSRDAFTKNLRFYMAKAGKSRKDISEAIGVSYFTFSDWCNGKKYPRIEKLEALAKHFGISVSELVGEKQSSAQHVNTPKTDKQEVLDIILRLHTDEAFLKIVEKMSALDRDKLDALQQFLKAFGE